MGRQVAREPIYEAVMLNDKALVASRPVEINPESILSVTHHPIMLAEAVGARQASVL